VGRFHSISHPHFSVVIEKNIRQILVTDGPELAVSLSLSGIRHLTAQWNKLMQILKNTVMDWRERRLSSKLYVHGGV
jgi:hypothetical protein